MAFDEVERKLRAILSADVVGYSRLMAEDEDATVRTLADYRDIVSLLVVQQRGEMADFTGDNFLASFPSAVDAVRGAMEIQRVLQARNAGLPVERRLEFRMGLNVGEVRIESGRLYGDGVNIAARLEALAEPGGLCLSEGALDEVRSRLDIEATDLGEQQVKNIPRPIRVYSITGPEKPKDRPVADRSTTSGEPRGPRRNDYLPVLPKR